jgi:antitoxin (DNA-binding transcriptional repressor) of toxin-antitoxin stability system
MAVIHVTEEEAARELASLIDRVKAGEEVRIDRGSETVAVLQSPEPGPKMWTISEAIRRAEARGSTVTLDDQFGDDMEEIIRRNSEERLIDPWESS